MFEAYEIPSLVVAVIILSIFFAFTICNIWKDKKDGK